MLAAGGDFNHGFTYSGHPTCAAVAVRNIELLRDERIVEHVHDVAAPHLEQRWSELADHPLVGEARTLGLLGAIELVADKQTRARFQPSGRAGEMCRDLAVKNGVVMRHVNESMIIAPPLIITREQIDELVDKARQDTRRRVGPVASVISPVPIRRPTAAGSDL